MESNEKDEGSNIKNEVLSVVKGKKQETMKKKTKDSNPKENKLRNNASKDEDDTESESEEELKNATSQKVHDILGIPMGNTKLQDLEQRDANDPFIAEWEEQYSHLQKPTPPAIASQISGTHEADFMFKMNFISLFGSTMGTLKNGGRTSNKMLEHYDDEEKNLDGNKSKMLGKSRTPCQLVVKEAGLHFNVFSRSRASITIPCNPVQHSRTKHIDVIYHFIKEKVEKGIIELFFVGTEYQLADVFTKALSEDRFKYLVRQLGMRCLTLEEEVLANESA
nr:peptidase C48, SUMO/sentrin/Ubl1 [Tanacetum cinerariifolium]